MTPRERALAVFESAGALFARAGAWWWRVTGVALREGDLRRGGAAPCAAGMAVFGQDLAFQLHCAAAGWGWVESVYLPVTVSRAAAGFEKAALDFKAFAVAWSRQTPSSSVSKTTVNELVSTFCEALFAFSGPEIPPHPATPSIRPSTVTGRLVRIAVQSSESAPALSESTIQENLVTFQKAAFTFHAAAAVAAAQEGIPEVLGEKSESSDVKLDKDAVESERHPAMEELNKVDVIIKAAAAMIEAMASEK